MWTEGLPTLHPCLLLGPWAPGRSATQHMNPQARMSHRERHALRRLMGQAPESHSSLPAHLLPRPEEGEGWTGESREGRGKPRAATRQPGAAVGRGAALQPGRGFSIL